MYMNLTNSSLPEQVQRQLPLQAPLAGRDDAGVGPNNEHLTHNMCMYVYVCIYIYIYIYIYIEREREIINPY